MTEFWNYVVVFLISMVPLIELRGSVVYAASVGLNPFIALAIAVLGNMLPVPIIYLFARRVVLIFLDFGCLTVTVSYGVST